jgi:hypothetical protein
MAKGLPTLKQLITDRIKKKKEDEDDDDMEGEGHMKSDKEMHKKMQKNQERSKKC